MTEIDGRPDREGEDTINIQIDSKELVQRFLEGMKRKYGKIPLEHSFICYDTRSGLCRWAWSRSEPNQLNFNGNRGSILHMSNGIFSWYNVNDLKVISYHTSMPSKKLGLWGL